MINIFLSLGGGGASPSPGTRANGPINMSNIEVILRLYI